MITIEIGNEKVTFYNVPHNVKTAIQTLLYNLEFGDSSITSDVEEVDEE